MKYQVIAQNDIEVTLVEQNSKLLREAEERIRINIRKASQKFKDPEDQEDFVVKSLSKISGK